MPFLKKKQSEVIEAFSITSSYLDDLLNIDNKYFDGLIRESYPSKLQLDKANSSETKAPCLDLYLSISDGLISCTVYDKRDGFYFEIVNFPALLGWGCSLSSILRCLYIARYSAR